VISLSFSPLPLHFVELHCRYDLAAIAQFKSTPGCYWDVEAKIWKAPIEAAELLAERLEKARIAKVKAPPEPPMWDTHVPERFLEGIYDYQKDGVRFLVSRAGRLGGAVLADEPGLGKSLMGLRAVQALRDPTGGRVLILCPAVVVPHWQQQITRWLGLPSTRLTKAAPTWEDGFAVCSYDTFRSITTSKPVGAKRLRYHVDAVSSARYVILDEIHYLSSSKAQRSKAVRRYLEEHETYGVIGLSGTPMLVRPKDLWNPLDLLWEGRFGSWFSFTERFCDARWEEIPGVEKKVWKHDGASNLEELSRRLKPLMLRRARSEVLKELPERQRILLPVEIPPDVAKSMSRAYADIDTSDSVQSLLSRVETFKLDAALQLAQDLEAQGRRPLLYTTRRETAEQLGKKLRWPWVTGETPAAERRAKLLAGGSGAVATVYSVTTGIDLLEFDVGIFCGLDYVPSTLLQAEGRHHRVGQTRSVGYYYLIGLGTIDELVQRVVIERLEHFVAVMGNAPDEAQMANDLTGADEDDILASIVELVKKEVERT
jgi:SNF2 family DNA or RNA helicase